MAKKRVLAGIINQVLDYLKEKIHINEAFIFGSYVTGKPDKWSDIDLAIFSPDVEGWTIEQKAELATSVKLNCNTGIELHIFPLSALAEARPTNFYGYIIKNGRKVA